MFPVLQIGPLALQTPGLILLLGVWLSLSAAERFSNRFNIQASSLSNLTFIALVAGILGARLGYAIQNPAAFIQNPINLLALNAQMLNLEAGLLAVVLAGLIYGQRSRLPLWSTLDALTPGLAVMALAIALANLASGDAYGAPTDLPWGILQWGAVRHPAQVYALLAAALIAFFIYAKLRKTAVPTAAPAAPGETFLIFASLTAGAQLFLDAFRGDSITLTGNIHLPQVLAWIVLAAALWRLNRVKLSKSKGGEQAHGAEG